MSPWLGISRLADMVAMLAVAGLCTVWLARAGQYRLALWWCMLFGLGLAIVTVSKLAFLGWGIGIPSINFKGPSGHTMRATAVMPVFLYLARTNWTHRWTVASILLGLGFGFMVGLSRLVLDAHSVSEVAGGFVIGAAVGLVFIFMLQKDVTRVRRSLETLLCIAFVFLSTIVEPAPTDRWLQTAAGWLIEMN